MHPNSLLLNLSVLLTNIFDTVYWCTAGVLLITSWRRCIVCTTGPVASSTIPAPCCAIPFTLNGAVHYSCVDNGTGDGCFYGERVWKLCQHPAGYRSWSWVRFNVPSKHITGHIEDRSNDPTNSVSALKEAGQVTEARHRRSQDLCLGCTLLLPEMLTIFFTRHPSHSVKYH